MYDKQIGTILFQLRSRVNNKLKMQKQTKFNFSPTHLALLQQLQNLFSRPNLCSNNYLYKEMTSNFQIPLAIISSERRIAQITTSELVLKQALQMCSLVDLIADKWIRVKEFPTLKFSNKFRELVQELARNLKIQNKNVLVFEKRDDSQIHLSLLESKSLKELEQIALNFNKQWDFKPADLKTDMKTGIARIRKLKQQNKRNFKGEKYSLDKPPGIFIRRAVQTSDEEQQIVKKGQTKSKKEQENEKEKDKRYREKPVINEEDFPTLS